MARNEETLNQALIRLAHGLSLNCGEAYDFYLYVSTRCTNFGIAELADWLESNPIVRPTPVLVVAKIQGLPYSPEIDEYIGQYHFLPSHNTQNPLPVRDAIGLQHPTSSQRATIKEIDWDPGSKSNPYESLVGAEDPFEHTPLLAGESVAFCRIDRVAYHLRTWEFLRDQNQARCCICGKKNVVEIVLLPCTEPVKSRVIFIPADTEKVIGLSEVRNWIGRAAVVEDYVHEVYITKTAGAAYIHFEKRLPTDPVTKGFKVVIRPKYFKEWEKIGLSPKIYEGHHVRVRGVIYDHQSWGMEVLINSPRLIQIVDQNALPIG